MDNIEQARSRVLQKVASLKDELTIWETKLKHLDEARRVMAEVDSEPGLVLVHASSNGSATDKAFASLGMTAAAQEALRHIGWEKSVTLKELRDYLVKHGLKPPVNFSPALNSTLNRLADRNVVEIGTRNGLKTFRIITDPKTEA